MKMSKPLNYHENFNDAIRGKSIVVEARKIGKIVLISGRTSRHGGQRTTARDAVAWIETPYIKP
jgi:hypothetical protein